MDETAAPPIAPTVAASPAAPSLKIAPIAIAVTVFWIALATMIFLEAKLHTQSETLLVFSLVAGVASIVTGLWLVVTVIRGLLLGVSWKRCSLAIYPATLPPALILLAFYISEFQLGRTTLAMLFVTYGTLAWSLFFPISAWHLQRKRAGQRTQLLGFAWRFVLVQMVAALLLLPGPAYVTATMVRTRAIYDNDPNITWAVHCVRATPVFVRRGCESLCRGVSSLHGQLQCILAKGELPTQDLDEYLNGPSSSDSTLQMLAFDSVFENDRQAALRITIDAFTNKTGLYDNYGKYMLERFAWDATDTELDQLLALPLSIDDVLAVAKSARPSRQQDVVNKILAIPKYTELFNRGKRYP
jgi:hypothetical protein